MPRPKRAQGRPNTPVIPAAWSEHHRPVVNKTLTGTCAIRHPGGTPGTFDPETGTIPVVPFAPHHTGPFRAQVLPALEQERVTAEDEATLVGYRVVVEWDAGTPGAGDIKVDDILTVTALDGNGDPTLLLRELTVRGVVRGTLAWERDLTCIDELG